jgi:hypothetical protein
MRGYRNFFYCATLTFIGGITTASTGTARTMPPVTQALEYGMKYQCGTDVMLGDEIMVQYGPNQESFARVVAI